VLLAFGAVPGLAVFYLRRQIHETPRFALAGGDAEEAKAAMTVATGGEAGPARPIIESKARNQQSVMSGWIKLAKNPRLLRWLIGAAAAWFALDFAYYGNTIASPAIIKLINPNASLIQETLIQLAIFVVAALPGYVVAIMLIDKTGRRRIQIQGFLMMALMFGLIAAIPGVTTTATTFLVLFGISYFFTEFGPNTTTFVYPAEIFPVDVRTSGNGIAAAAGKMGAFAGTYLFPQMLAGWGIRGAEGVAGGFAVIGLLVTFVLLPEPRGKSLEELTDEAYGRMPALAVAPA
jgi:MFS transporter, PHS family, inorganic phosphate transporter